MELQELVERIEAWKSRIAVESSGATDSEAVAIDTEATLEAASAVASNELDFEEMDLAEIPNADSGIVIAEAIDEDEDDADMDDAPEVTEDDENFADLAGALEEDESDEEER